jgi:hypothetical protein
MRSERDFGGMNPHPGQSHHATAGLRKSRMRNFSTFSNLGSFCRN